MRIASWWSRMAPSSKAAGMTSCCGAAVAMRRSIGSSCAAKSIPNRARRRETVSLRSSPRKRGPSSWLWIPAYAGMSDRLRRRSGERGINDPGGDQGHHRVFERIVGVVVPSLHALAQRMNLVDLTEHLVDEADLLAFLVLRGGGLDQMLADPAIDRGHEAELHRPLDVAEQDDAIHVRAVFGGVDVGLVEHDGFAVAPHALLAIDDDEAVFGVRRDQPEGIAQRSGERVAMRAELGTRRQHREHRAMHVRDRAHQRDRLRAELRRRRKRVLVPLEIKALPAALEERIEAQVVVVRRRLDAPLVEQVQRFFADGLPVVAQRRELREMLKG